MTLTRRTIVAALAVVFVAAYLVVGIAQSSHALTLERLRYTPFVCAPHPGQHLGTHTVRALVGPRPCFHPVRGAR